MAAPATKRCLHLEGKKPGQGGDIINFRFNSKRLVAHGLRTRFALD